MNRRTALTLGAALALLALYAPPAMAAAGGGSSSFGGGGGGGNSGGGSSYGGSGSGSGEADPLTFAILGAGLVLFLIYWMFRKAVNAFVRERMARRRAKRVARVEAAAAEAAQDDAAFAADSVRAGADHLFRTIQKAWSNNDIETLDKLVAPELMKEWRRRLDDFKRKSWRNVVDVIGKIQVEYVGLVNRADDEDDRCVVRIEARLQDYVLGKGGQKINRTDATSEFTTLREYWTLGKDGADRWRLLSIEQDAEGAHHVEAEIVASPWDDSRLRDEALVEGAVADKVEDGYKISDVADLDFDGDARAAALDLSLADARFGPDVLETAARRAVGGWAEAVDGEDADLAAVATPAAMRDLLYPGGHKGRRLVVRGPKVERLHIAALDAAAEPPTMTVEVTVRGRRYVQDRDTAAILSGSEKDETTFTERWLLALGDDAANPWKIVDAAAGVSAGG
jgi:predicted lipid-binding transport protein (Tim44 family)